MSDQARVLIIDDDEQLVEAVRLYLTRLGYKVTTAMDGREGLQTMYLDRPDLIVLDIMMPVMDGWETCERIREVSNVPIVMLTARGQEADLVKGLRMGADDYVMKPFSLKELEARVQAVLRRSAWVPAPEMPITYSDDHLIVNLAERRVLVGGELLDLTPTEYRLLAYMVQNAGQVLTYRQLLEKVWGWEYTGDIDYVRVYVWRLRKKIERDSSNPEYILTEHGVGYRFRKAV